MKQFMALAAGTLLALAILAVASLMLLNAGGATQTVLAAKGAGGAETRLIASLRATPDGGLMSGKADYRANGASSRLNIQVEDAAADGSYGVAIWRPGNAAAVFQGTIAVAAGLGQTQLTTNDGQTVPVIQAGDVVQVYSPDGNLVLSGHF